MEMTTVIQLLGLRPFYNEEKQREEFKHVFFKKNWRAESVPELLKNIDEYIKAIPEEERFNMFFTVANTEGKRPRDFDFQTVLPIDIDGVDNAQKVAECICNELGLSYGLTGVVDSGNGVHLYVSLDAPIERAAYFDEKRLHYKALCKRINFALSKAMLKGEADPAVWDRARIMRLPNTVNNKQHKGLPDTECTILNAHMEPQGISLESLCGIPEVGITEQIAPSALKNFPKPDTETILAECEFLKDCKSGASALSELHWYAMLSILPHLKDGRVLAHDYSRPHPGYSQVETDDKIEQAMVASGPRTCANINAISDACKKCKHFPDLKSPILIQGPGFIRTKDTGFHDVIVSETGKVTKKPNFNDLLKYFQEKHPFKTNDSGVVWGFNGKFWVEISRSKIKEFAETHFNPKPKQAMRAEFLDKVRSTNLVGLDWFDNKIDGYVNFENGVLDMKTNVLHKHSTKFGFRGVLPYPYDPSAECPVFDHFLDQVTVGRDDLKEVLKEYIGYALSGDSIWLHRVLFLQGDGANGKSTLMDVIKYLVGKEFYSSLTLTAINDAQKRALLEGKMVNLGDETNIKSLLKSELFKTISSGGEYEIKRLYAQPYEVTNRAKFIVACNKLPYSQDDTYGFHRRMLIVPFEATFTEGKNADPMIKEKLVAEAAGIFNSCTRAYQKVKEQRCFTKSETIESITDEYKAANDNVRTWYEDFVSTDVQSDFITSEELYLSYKNEADRRGEYKQPQRAFEMSMSKLVPKDSKLRRTINGVRRHGYKGVRLASVQL